MSSRKEKSATLYIWMSSGSVAMDLNSFSSAFLTPEKVTRNSLAFRGKRPLQITAIYWNESLRTDCIELDVFATQVRSSHVNVILGFAIGDQHSDLSGGRSHPDVLFEIILEDVVQSQACKTRVRRMSQRKRKTAPRRLRYGNTCPCVSSFVGKVSHGLQQRLPCWMGI